MGLSWERKEPQVCPVDRERVFCKATLNCFFGGVVLFFVSFFFFFSFFSHLNKRTFHNWFIH